MIRIHLQGDPGHRRGTVQIGTEGPDLRTWQIASWHRAEHGHVHITTTDGEPMKLTLDGSNGGLCRRFGFVHIRRAVWDGLVLTGETPGVSDAEMAAQFPGCGWK